MSLTREIPPTAGLPILTKEVAQLIFKKPAPYLLEESLQEYLGAIHIRITYSGTAALYIILESLKEISNKKTVVIPSFICPLVPLAILRAGLKPAVCDISPKGFDFQREKLEKITRENNDVLAVIPTHLAGIPIDIKSYAADCKNKGILIIEDCAQSLGSKNKGIFTGTTADFSFYSFCRGKGITTYEGGAIACKSEFKDLIDKNLNRISKEDRLSETLKLVELLGYWIFYRPALFWFVFRLPQLFWEIQGKTERANIEYFTSDFPVHKVSEKRKYIGALQLKRLEQEIDKQREKTFYYLDGLKGLKDLNVISEGENHRSNYPFLTILFQESRKRDKILQKLNNSGLGVSRIYLNAITDYRYLKEIYSPGSCPNASSIAKRHITLSTSTFIKKADQDYIIKTIKET